MIKNLAEKAASFFTSKNTSLEVNREIYSYGLELIFSNILYFGMLFILSLILDSFWEMLFFLLFFFPVRGYAGGYHADSHTKCIILSIVTGLLIVPVVRYTEVELQTFLSLAFILISMLSIYFLAPIIHENNPLTGRQIERARETSIIIGLVEGIIISLGLWIIPGYSDLLMAAAYGSFTAGISLLFAKILKKERGKMI